MTLLVILLYLIIGFFVTYWSDGIMKRGDTAVHYEILVKHAPVRLWFIYLAFVLFWLPMLFGAFFVVIFQKKDKTNGGL